MTKAERKAAQKAQSQQTTTTEVEQQEEVIEERYEEGVPVETIAEANGEKQDADETFAIYDSLEAAKKHPTLKPDGIHSNKHFKLNIVTDATKKLHYIWERNLNQAIGRVARAQGWTVTTEGTTPRKAPVNDASINAYLEVLTPEARKAKLAEMIAKMQEMEG